MFGLVYDKIKKFSKLSYQHNNIVCGQTMQQLWRKLSFFRCVYVVHKKKHQLAPYDITHALRHVCVCSGSDECTRLCSGHSNTSRISSLLVYSFFRKRFGTTNKGRWTTSCCVFFLHSVGEFCGVGEMYSSCFRWTSNIFVCVRWLSESDIWNAGRNNVIWYSQCVSIYRIVYMYSQ